MVAPGVFDKQVAPARHKSLAANLENTSLLHSVNLELRGVISHLGCVGLGSGCLQGWVLDWVVTRPASHLPEAAQTPFRTTLSRNEVREHILARR